MVTFNRLEAKSDAELSKAKDDAEYWRMTLVDEMRIARIERDAAMFFGFVCGASIVALILVLL